jgi:uncharacterized membrane protein YcaP (DUF421 family)
MKAFEAPEWAEMFVPDASVPETFLRASVVYLSLLVLFRVILKRQGGAIGLPDVMLVVLVSECVSPALTAQASAVPNGLVAVLALLFWNFALDWLASRWGWFRRLLEPDPVQLVRDGKPIEEHMRAEGITDDELAAQLRENGVDDVARVKAAFIESGGSVSVIPKADPPPAELTAAIARLVAAAEQAWAAAEAARKLLSRLPPPAPPGSPR